MVKLENNQQLTGKCQVSTKNILISKQNLKTVFQPIIMTYRKEKQKLANNNELVRP